VGENGAGKTTLFRCLAGLEKHGGTLHSTWSPLRDHLGFLSTEPFFFAKLTGGEYLQFVCNARGLKGVDWRAKNLFELPLDQYASTYSTGMKKKLALTGLLLQDNEVLILDEPFNGVDIQSNLLILAILQKLRERGKMVVIASHIFSTLTEVCDEIHLLRDGVLARSVSRDGFASLDQEMREVSIGGRLEAFGWT
jgi:ABC-2 type transport system ATP-binding protein